MYSILLATNVTNLNKQISLQKLNLELSTCFTTDNELSLLSCLKENQIDILLISKRFQFNNLSVIDYLISLKEMYPKMKIIYISGPLNEFDIIKQKELIKLIENNIYNIYTEKKITLELIKKMITVDKTKEDLLDILNMNLQIEDITRNKEEFKPITIDKQEDFIHYKLDNSKQYDNVILVTSIKPGTGKSFISSNLAMTISKYGERTKLGNKPKIAYIEADLQNLSIGTILGLNTESNNLKEVLSKIQNLFKDEIELDINKTKKDELDNFILSSFQLYNTVPTLYSLVGSHFQPNELSAINMNHYLYLIDVISKQFDLVIIDTNSSMINDESLPLLQLCKFALFVVNLDFNNIRNNGRYQEYLKIKGYSDKIHYILNEDIDEDNRRLLNIPTFEDLICNSTKLETYGLELLSKIPEIPKELFYNRLYLGKPIILDNTEITLKVRLELTKLANQFWNIENLNWLENEYEKFQGRKFLTNRGSALF